MDAKFIFPLCCPHHLYCFSEISAAYEDKWHRLPPPVRTDIEGLRNLKPETFFSCRRSLNPILLVRSWMMTELVNRWVALCSLRTFFVGSSVNRRSGILSFRFARLLHFFLMASRTTVFIAAVCG